MTMNTLIAPWEKIAQDMLVGRTVETVRYLSEEETKSLGWYGTTILLDLRGKDGSLIAVYASTDNEGNGPGALFTTDEKHSVLPVF